MSHDNPNTDPACPNGMVHADQGAYPRYLAAKKSIDDRALNHHVWQELHQVLPQTTRGAPLNVLEIGAGIGTMLVRAMERRLLTGASTYVATDRDPAQLLAARPYLSRWAAKQGHCLLWFDEHRGRLRTSDAEVSVMLGPADAEALAAGTDLPGPFHLLIAHAVLDLVDFASLLPRLLARLTPHGLALLTCNFDGGTVFLPECEGDEEIIRCYHADMEARLAGASRTGRRLLAFLQRPGLEILAAGCSDWIVLPRNGDYSMDETHFLHAIIETVEQALGKKGHPPAGLRDWVRLRHRQVASGELTFLARNLDFLVRRRSQRS